MPPTPRKPRAKPTAATARANIQARINEKLGDATVIDALIADALEAEITLDATCPECGERLKARAPDIKKRVDTLIALLEQGEGRVEQRAPGDLNIVIYRPDKPEMTPLPPPKTLG